MALLQLLLTVSVSSFALTAAWNHQKQCVKDLSDRKIIYKAHNKFFCEEAFGGCWKADSAQSGEHNPRPEDYYCFDAGYPNVLSTRCQKSELFRKQTAEDPLLRVLNGNTIGEINHLIQVVMDRGMKNGHHEYVLRCSATLISERIVLAAGHCFPRCNTTKSCSSYTKSTRIAVFRSNYTKQELYKVVKIRVNKGYFNKRGFFAKNKIDDLALVKLAKPVKDIQFPCLPEFSDTTPTEVDPDVKCYAAGWGRRGIQENYTIIVSPFDRPIRRLSLMVVDDCSAFAKPDTMICARDANKRGSVCKGDSGTPLLCKGISDSTYQILGVLSMGSRPCWKTSPTYRSYFVSTALYHNWIQKVLREWK